MVNKTNVLGRYIHYSGDSLTLIEDLADCDFHVIAKTPSINKPNKITSFQKLDDAYLCFNSWLTEFRRGLSTEE